MTTNTSVDIANAALTYIGERNLLSTINDTVPVGKAVRAVYDFEREAELRSHTWNFAVARAQLSALSGNDTYTKALLAFDGADAATTINDTNNGGSAHTWTANGNAQIDTAASKFGGASGLFDGTGDYVSASDHADFALGSGDFTIDLWFNCSVASGTEANIAGQSDSTPTAASTSFYVKKTTADKIEAAVYVGSTQYAVTSSTLFTSATNTGWHHLALVRTGSVLKLFLDGVQEGGDTTISGTVNDSSSALAVGRRGEVTTNTWNGWLDEFRLSVGIARWTVNFSPPASAYTTANLPAFEFDYSFGLPTDYLRLVSLHSSDAGNHGLEYKIETISVAGTYTLAIVTNSSAAYLRYIRNVSDVGLMSINFRRVLALRIAQRLAVGLADKPGLMERIDTDLRRTYAQARSVDGIEDFPEQFPIPSWAASRHRSQWARRMPWGM